MADVADAAAAEDEIEDVDDDEEEDVDDDEEEDVDDDGGDDDDDDAFCVPSAPPDLPHALACPALTDQQ